MSLTHIRKNGFISIEEGSCVVATIKMLENDMNDKLLIRLYETDGSKTKVTVKFYKNPKSAYFVDINENKIFDTKSICIKGERVGFDVVPFNIYGLAIKFYFIDTKLNFISRTLNSHI